MSITIVDTVVATQGATPLTNTYSAAPSVGDVLIAFVNTSQNPAYPSTPTGSNVVVTDSINGTYNLLNYYYDPTTDNFLATYWIVATSISVPVVTCTFTVSGYAYLSLAHFKGFAGTPTADSSAFATFSGTGTSISCSPIASSHANEVLLFSFFAGASYISQGQYGVTGWVGVSTSESYYAIENSPVTNNFSGTFPSSVSWTAMSSGIYDVPAPIATIAWLL